MSITKQELIDYIAQGININQALGAGYGCGTRWWCTRADLKQETREEAIKRVRAWADEDTKAEKDTDAHDAELRARLEAEAS